jgi:hypothetical protein
MARGVGFAVPDCQTLECLPPAPINGGQFPYRIAIRMEEKVLVPHNLRSILLVDASALQGAGRVVSLGMVLKAEIERTPQSADRIVVSLRAPAKPARCSE